MPPVNFEQRLQLFNSVERGEKGGIGIRAPSRFSMKSGVVMATFGRVVLRTFQDVTKRSSCWSRHCISVSTVTAANQGVVLDPTIDYVLAPRAVSHDRYIFGELINATPLGDIDQSTKGAMFNTCLDGETPHLTWKVTYSKLTKEWGVDIICLRDFNTRSCAIELLLYYGTEYV